MGRAKANMELIKKETQRNNAFQKRNASLMKKADELTVLCDIKAVVIVYGPKQGASQALSLEPEIWPQNRDEVLQMIDKYKGQLPEDRKKRTTLLSDFFDEKIEKAQQAVTKLRKANVQSKYPTWDSRFDSLKEEDLRKFVNFMEKNIGNAKARLGILKANNICHAYHVQQQQHMMLSDKRSMDFDAENQAHKYMKIDPNQPISKPMRVPIIMPFPIHHHRFPIIDHNRMVKFSNASVGGTSNIVHNNAPPLSTVYEYPMMAGTLHSISYVHNLAMAPPNYYVDGSWQPISQHAMEYHPMTQKGLLSHQMVAASQQYYEDQE